MERKRRKGEMKMKAKIKGEKDGKEREERKGRDGYKVPPMTR